MAVQKSSYTLRQLLTQVQSDAGMRGVALVTIEDVVRWGNQAQKRIALETKWYRTETTAGTTINIKYYDFPAISASIGELLSIEDIYHDSIPLIQVTQREMGQIDWNWRQEGTGTPVYWYRRGFNGYALHPTPDTTDSDILTIYYAALPPAVADGDDTFYVPTALEEAITCFCSWRAAIKDATGEGRDRLVIFGREWEQWEGKIQSFVRSAAEGELLVLGSDNSPSVPDVWSIFDRGVVS